MLKLFTLDAQLIIDATITLIFCLAIFITPIVLLYKILKRRK